MSSSNTPSLFHCPDCPANNGEIQSKFETVDELESHIAGDHLDLCPYECERCRFAKFPTEYALVDHCRKDHGLKEFHIRYKWNEDVERRRLDLKHRMRIALKPYISSHVVSSMSSAELVNSVNSNPSFTQPPGSAVPGLSAMSIQTRQSQAMKMLKQEATSAANGVSSGLSIDEVLQSVINGKAQSQYNQMVQNLQQQETYTRDQQSELCTTSNGPIISTGGEISPMDLGSASGEQTGDYPVVTSQSQAADEEPTTKKPRDVVICQMCGLKVSNQRSSLVYHTNTKHGKLSLYQCRVCQKTWQTIAKSDVLKHIKAVHGGDESMIIDNRKVLAQKLRHWTLKCFPAREKKKHMSEGMDPHPPATTADSAMCVLDNMLEGAGFVKREEPCLFGGASGDGYSCESPQVATQKGGSSESGMEQDDELDGDGEGDEGSDEDEQQGRQKVDLKLPAQQAAGYLNGVGSQSADHSVQATLQQQALLIQQHGSQVQQQLLVQQVTHIN